MVQLHRCTVATNVSVLNQQERERRNKYEVSTVHEEGVPPKQSQYRYYCLFEAFSFDRHFIVPCYLFISYLLIFILLF